MIKFTEVKWLQRWMRGRSFGFHGKTTAYLMAGDVVGFTPETEMMNWSLKVGASRIRFWNKNYAVLTDGDGKVYPLYGFVTKDGLEPASRPEGHWDGRERQGLDVGRPMMLTLYGSGKVRLTYAGASLNR